MWRIFIYSFLLSLFLCNLQATAQKRCGTTEAEIIRLAKKSQNSLKKQADFENWLQNKINLKNQNKKNQKILEQVYTIPVVVHIIHQGESVGQGTNLSTAQIQSQIDVLNEDFRKLLGTKGFNNHPDGADVEVEFKLATADPEGMPTNGIVRVKGEKNFWYMENDNNFLKKQSYWDAENYMNLWVCDLRTTQGGLELLGYAQFPESDILDGLEDDTVDGETDGVVINYKYFGREGGVQAPFNLGRTTTHEVGHYLGLRHIWGDAAPSQNGCQVDDYCDDTPNSAEENTGCPNPPKMSCENGKLEMIENYMDYTEDACMNIFTNDQKTRIRIIMDNSLRRVSLKNSPAFSPLLLVNDNTGIQKIIDPGEIYCNTTLIPQVVIRNYGANTLTTAKIIYNVDNGADNLLNWNGNLLSGEIATVALNPINLVGEEHTFDVKTADPNGVVDAVPENDAKKIDFSISTLASLPMAEDFQNLPFEDTGIWSIQNDDNLTTWKDTLAAGINAADNHAAYIDLYNYSKSNGQLDAFVSPPYDFSNILNATLSFKVSHKPFEENGIKKEDILAVVISTDCGVNFDQTVYLKTSSKLNTTNTTTTEAWHPSQASDWRLETVDLSSLIGETKVQFAFVAVNDFGNNIYVDDVKVLLVSGLEEPLKEEVLLYPNPSTGIFQIKWQNTPPLEISIWNMLGRQVYQKNISKSLQNTLDIDLNNQTKGMYLLKYNDGKKVITKKIVLQ